MKNCIKCNQKLEDNAIFCNSCGASQETENQIDSVTVNDNETTPTTIEPAKGFSEYFKNAVNYAKLDKESKKKVFKQTLLGGFAILALVFIIPVVCVFVSDLTKSPRSQPTGTFSTSDTSEPTEIGEHITENIALFKSNSGAIYTYTLKDFNDRINRRLGAELFNYSEWEKRDLQTQEKSGVEFVSYTYDIVTGNSLTGMIEVLVEKDSNYILGINIGVDSNADDGKAAPTAITWGLLGCGSEIDDNTVNTILSRFLDNLKNGKYEMFYFNNSSFELYKENGMIMVSILPISDTKIEENNLVVIEPPDKNITSESISSETTEQQETSEPVNLFQRTWTSSDGLYQMNIAEVYEDGSIVGTLKISNGSHSMSFEISASPNDEGTYYSQLNDGYTTTDIWFYFPDENQMQCSLNSEDGDSIQFTMN